MNARRAHRRWLRWGRYVAATGTMANRLRGWGTDTHTGQAKAYHDCMFAGRANPAGIRVPYYPPWVTRG